VGSFELTMFGVLVVLSLLVLRGIVHIVPEYQRLIVFRLGAFEKVAGPGVVLLLPPPIQHVAQTVDLREFVVWIKDQTCVTKDNVPVSIDLLVYEKVVDPTAAFLKVQNPRNAVLGLAAKLLRSAVADTPSDLVLAERDQIGDEVREKLDETTRRWGVQVTNVEIKELNIRSGVKGAA
jgi:regulator of protease activity HflC (stomatin/prohibitin superfamily)